MNGMEVYDASIYMEVSGMTPMSKGFQASKIIFRYPLDEDRWSDDPRERLAFVSVAEMRKQVGKLAS